MLKRRTQRKYFLTLACLLSVAFWMVGCEGASTSPLTPSETIAEPKVETEPAQSEPEPSLRSSLPESFPSLQELYLAQKYTDEERQAVRDAVTTFYPNLSWSRRVEIERNVLGFHHVVYHGTEYHNLLRNHKVAKAHEPEIRRKCKLLGVPAHAVLGITSWENSGAMTKVSWANAAGLGQMTWGAIEEAHDYATRLKARKTLEFKALQKQFMVDEVASEIPLEAKQRLGHLQELISILDVAERHADLTKKAGLKDERLVASCNIEDVVLYLKFLLEAYGDRVDLAVGSYHRGIQNTDDIVHEYLSEKQVFVDLPKPEDRTEFIAAIEQVDVSYLDLWENPRTREMLNGLRTVHGDLTTPKNKHLALGDESDIYNWKILASYAGFTYGPDFVQAMMKRYASSQDKAEYQDLSYEGYTLEQGVAAGRIFEREDWGGKPATVELIHYLENLERRWQKSQGGAPFALQVQVDKPWSATIHFSENLKGRPKAALRYLLRRDYLWDRVYLKWSSENTLWLGLNPRYANEYE